MNGNGVAIAVTPREAGLEIATGFQGTGKTYTSLRDTVSYLNWHPQRKVLIYDVNGEFTYNECMKHGVNLNILKLPPTIQAIQAFTHHQVERIRRIVPLNPDGTMMDIEGKKELLKIILNNFKRGFLFVEDMNKYVTQTHHMQEVVSVLISMRHQNLDGIVHLQSITKIDPTLWQNVQRIRMHWESDSVHRIKYKITNYKLYRIAELLVRYMYHDVGNERFYCTIYPQKNKIDGYFSEQDFYLAFYRYLKSEKRELADARAILSLGKDMESIKKATEYLYQRAASMYGNPV